VFAGSFSMQAAQAVAADDTLGTWGVLDAVGALLDKSLLMPLDPVLSPIATNPTDVLRCDLQRLRMLESVRAFAMEQLTAASEATTLEHRHQDWVLGHWRHMSEAMHEAPMFHWMDALAPDMENLRVAMRHALADDARLPLAVELFCHCACFCIGDLKHDALQWWQALRHLGAEHPEPALRARFHQAEAMLAVEPFRGLGFRIAGRKPAPLDEAPFAEAAARRALALHRELEQPFEAYLDSFLLLYLKLQTNPQGDHGALLAEMRSLEDPQWSLVRRRYGRFIAGALERYRGRLTAHRSHCAAELAVARSTDDDLLAWATMHLWALTEHEFGHDDEAKKMLRQVIDAASRAGRIRHYPLPLAALAALQAMDGHSTEAAALARKAAEGLSPDRTLWTIGTELACVLLSRAHVREAARLLSWTQAQMARHGIRPGRFTERLMVHCRSQLSASRTDTRANAQPDRLDAPCVDADELRNLLMSAAPELTTFAPDME
jgi:hypothetical protein